MLEAHPEARPAGRGAGLGLAALLAGAAQPQRVLAVVVDEGLEAQLEHPRPGDLSTHVTSHTTTTTTPPPTSPHVGNPVWCNAMSVVLRLHRPHPRIRCVMETES